MPLTDTSYRIRKDRSPEQTMRAWDRMPFLKFPVVRSTLNKLSDNRVSELQASCKISAMVTCKLPAVGIRVSDVNGATPCPNFGLCIAWSVLQTYKYWSLSHLEFSRGG